MIMFPKVRKKRYGLFVLAAFLLICAGVAMYLGWNNFGIRSIGLVLLIASVYLVKLSNVRGRKDVAAISDPDADSKAAARPGSLMWTVGIAMLVALGISIFYLYKDAHDGYHDVLPVYVFAGVGVVCGLFWSYLVMKLLRHYFGW